MVAGKASTRPFRGCAQRLADVVRQSARRTLSRTCDGHHHQMMTVNEHATTDRSDSASRRRGVAPRCLTTIRSQRSHPMRTASERRRGRRALSRGLLLPACLDTRPTKPRSDDRTAPAVAVLLAAQTSWPSPRRCGQNGPLRRRPCCAASSVGCHATVCQFLVPKFVAATLSGHFWLGGRTVANLSPLSSPAPEGARHLGCFHPRTSPQTLTTDDQLLQIIIVDTALTGLGGVA